MDNTELNLVDDQLEHWGIKGMRWGIRRFQNPDGSLTKEGRKRYNDQVEKVKAKGAKLDAKLKAKAEAEKQKAKIDKLKAENAAKKKKLKGEDDDEDAVKKPKGKSEEKDKESSEESKTLSKEELNALKNQAIMGGSAKEILKYQGQFTNTELQYAVNRLGLEKQLSQISESETNTMLKKLNKAADYTGAVADLSTKGTTAYNNIAKAINSFFDKKLPIIGEKKGNDGKVTVNKVINKTYNKEYNGRGKSNVDKFEIDTFLGTIKREKPVKT